MHLPENKYCLAVDPHILDTASMLREKALPLMSLVLLTVACASACGDDSPSTGNDDVESADAAPMVLSDGAVNRAPTAVLLDRDVLVGETVELSGAMSTDPDGDPLTYAWQLQQGAGLGGAALSATDGEAVTFVPDVSGMYFAEFVVNDGQWDSAPVLAVVTVRHAVDTGDVVNGVFNPREVYLFGTLNPGTCSASAMAHWLEPNTSGGRFACSTNGRGAQIRDDGTMLYVEKFEDILREFHCDDCPPNVVVGNPLDNDAILSTTSCDVIETFIQGVEGRLHKCFGDWYRENGVEIPSLTERPLSYGYADRVLTATRIVNLASGVSIPITGLSSSIVTSRVLDATHFQVVVESNPGKFQLWKIGHDGVAVLIGAYPALPDDQFLAPAPRSRIDGHGSLLQFGYSYDEGIGGDSIIYRSVGGLSEVIYREEDDPLVKIHISALVTGP